MKYSCTSEKDVAGPTYGLQSLDLSGNGLQEAAHLNTLAQLPHLTKLRLGKGSSANPVCRRPDTRSKVFALLQGLTDLDGFGRNGATVDEYGYGGLTGGSTRAPAGLQRYLDALEINGDDMPPPAAGPPRQQEPQHDRGLLRAADGRSPRPSPPVVSVNTPKIDQVLDEYRRRILRDDSSSSPTDGDGVAHNNRQEGMQAHAQSQNGANPWHAYGDNSADSEPADAAAQHTRDARTHRVMYLHRRRNGGGGGGGGGGGSGGSGGADGVDDPAAASLFDGILGVGFGGGRQSPTAAAAVPSPSALPRPVGAFSSDDSDIDPRYVTNNTSRAQEQQLQQSGPSPRSSARYRYDAELHDDDAYRGQRHQHRRNGAGAGDVGGDEGAAQRGRQGHRNRRPDLSDGEASVTAQLGKELFDERLRRTKAERTAKKLVSEMKSRQHRTAKARQEHEATVGAIGQLQGALQEAETRNNRLRDALDAAGHERRASTQTVAALKLQLDSALELETRAKRELASKEDEFDRLAADRSEIKFIDSRRSAETDRQMAAVSAELDVYKRSLAQAKKQIHHLHELLAVREGEHRDAAKGLVDLQGPEVKAALTKARAEQEKADGIAFRAIKAQLAEQERSYRLLENELRKGLEHEAARFQKVQESALTASRQASETEQALDAKTASEAKLKGLLKGLSDMAKQQQTAIRELSSKEKALVEAAEDAEALAGKEAARANSVEAQSLALAKDVERAVARAANLETVLAGLRDERALWSRELAAQGAALSADRGTLESKTAALEAELEAVKQQAANHEESALIKTKLVEDQADSLRKLKISLNERDRELKTARDEYSRREGDLEDRLEAERGLSQQLHADLESAHQKKTTAREQLSEVLGDLESLKRAEPKLQEALRAKDAMLDQVGTEIEALKASFNKREQQLIADKVKAISAFERLEQQLQQCNAAFRQQLAAKAQQYEAVLQLLQQAKQESAQAREHERAAEQKAATLSGEISAMKQNSAAKMEQIKELLSGQG